MTPPVEAGGQGHTAGPWLYTATVAMHDRPDLPCVVDQFQLVVAQCWDDGHSEEECEANARLIAAAPELLSEGERLISSLEAGTALGVADAMDGLRAAIAKARGHE